MWFLLVIALVVVVEMFEVDRKKDAKGLMLVLYHINFLFIYLFGKLSIYLSICHFRLFIYLSLSTTGGLTLWSIFLLPLQPTESTHHPVDITLARHTPFTPASPLALTHDVAREIRWKEV